MSRGECYTLLKKNWWPPIHLVVLSWECIKQPTYITSSNETERRRSCWLFDSMTPSCSALCCPPHVCSTTLPGTGRQHWCDVVWEEMSGPECRGVCVCVCLSGREWEMLWELYWISEKRYQYWSNIATYWKSSFPCVFCHFNLGDTWILSFYLASNFRRTWEILTCVPHISYRYSLWHETFTCFPFSHMY